MHFTTVRLEHSLSHVYLATYFKKVCFPLLKHVLMLITLITLFMYFVINSIM